MGTRIKKDRRAQAAIERLGMYYISVIVDSKIEQNDPEKNIFNNIKDAIEFINNKPGHQPWFGGELQMELINANTDN